jgi:hypothetical protein
MIGATVRTAEAFMRPPALLLLALLPLAARADGCKFTPTGRKVPEREQRAMIAWADGVETLHVATLAEPTAEPTVWLVPVRAAAAAVRAEPVEEFPAVVYYDTLRRQAQDQLVMWSRVAAVLDSGGMCCVLLGGGCDDKAKSGFKETSRVEKLGMVVTVVSADSRVGLERYLEAQGVNHKAADLSSLDPYFGKPEFAFVCGWVVRPGEAARATGLHIEFPSPTLWFPLRPTRAYTNPVQTVVYARGFVKPADGCDLPGLRCEYIYGHVQNRGVGQTFEADWHGRPMSGSQEELTRITLTADPQQWDRDLELVPGTTAAGSVALLVTGNTGAGIAWVVFALLGAVVGLGLPWVVVPRGERQGFDWLCGALTGAALALTLWMSLFVLLLWRYVRFGDQPSRPRCYLVLLPLALAHWLAAAGVCAMLRWWVQSA